MAVSIDKDTLQALIISVKSSNPASGEVLVTAREIQALKGIFGGIKYLAACPGSDSQEVTVTVGGKIKFKYIGEEDIH